MRGKAGTESSTPTSARITPAYAGKRNGQSPTMLLRRDHPRVCGEKNAILSGRKTEPGSPPRMRGKVRPSGSLLCLNRDHPRVCGEKRHQRRTDANGRGSPPRMRGKGPHGGRRRGLGGITPAYAGKSHSQLPLRTPVRDHPRVCGEKCVVLLVLCCGLGSPPRMRGKVVHGVVLALDVGITPAYAGKSFFVRVGLGVDRDHPRVCGEKSPN